MAAVEIFQLILEIYEYLSTESPLYLLRITKRLIFVY